MLRKTSTINFCLIAGIGIFRFLGLGVVLAAEPNPTQPVCLEPIGVRQLIVEHPELTGAAVRIAIIELCQSATPRTKQMVGAYENQLAFLPNLKHQALQESNLSALHYFYNPYRPAGNSSHASLIAGILTGHDPNAGFAGIGDFAYRGIVPEAELEIFETNWFLYKRVLSPQAEAMNNDVLTLSWGTDATDRVTMLWQRGIDALAVRDGCVIVAGCGNGEGKFSAISKPSWGGNIISVGAARSLGVFPDNLKYLGPPTPDFSSCGPTDDGRAKPDIIAPGLALGPDAYSQDGYRCAEHGIGYSSFAAPQVAGVAALLIDAARRHQVANGDDPRLIKALLLNGATKLCGWHKGSSDPADDPYVPLDYRQGAGLVNARNSYQQLMAGRYIPNLRDILESVDQCKEMLDPNDTKRMMILAEVKEYFARNIGWDVSQITSDRADPNSTRIYTLPKLIPEGGEFKATLTWYKPYSMYGSFKELPLPQLALELWSVDPNGALQERLDYSDSELDNLQHIYYRSTRPMRMTLVVKSAADPPTKEKLISYALAYSDTDEPFSGDQLGADFNADGTVDVGDLMQFLEVWRSHQNNGDLADRALLLPYLPEDLNLDGLVNTQDFEQISGQWHQRSVWHRAGKKVKVKR
jgi:subtilase family protein